MFEIVLRFVFQSPKSGKFESNFKLAFGNLLFNEVVSIP